MSEAASEVFDFSTSLGEAADPQNVSGKYSELFAVPALKGRLAIDGASELSENVDEFCLDIEEHELFGDLRKNAEIAFSTDSLGDYLKEIGKIPLLNAEDEVVLAKSIEVGILASERIVEAEETSEKLQPQLRCDLQTLVHHGERDKKLFVEANLRLVVSIAKRYTVTGMSLADVIQEGNIGLIGAVEKFDYTRGNRFSTYATKRIRGDIARAIADKAKQIRLPVHYGAVVNTLGYLQQRLLQDLGRQPTTAELAKEMDITPAAVLELQQNAREPLSLNQKWDNQDTQTLGDIVEDSNATAPEDALAVPLLQNQLELLLQTLSKREAEVVKRRCGLTDGRPHTFIEIAQEDGIAHQGISFIYRRALDKLRQPQHSQVLKDYLDD